MPLYTYDCPDCGPFQASRSLADFDSDAACPGCATQSPRSLAAPTLLAMPAGKRQAYARNEKSAWSPDVVRRDGGHQSGHVHGPGCGHGHAQGGRKHVHSGGKPWMVGHSH